MCRGFRRYASLVVCVCFILSMLFSNTLLVRAEWTATDIYTSYSASMSANFGDYSDTRGQINGISGSGIITNGSGTINVYGGSGLIYPSQGKQGGMYHVKIPCSVSGNYSGAYGPSDPVGFVLYLTQFSVSGVNNYSNVCITDYNGDLLSIGKPSTLDGVAWHYCTASDVWSAGAKAYRNFYLEFDCEINGTNGETNYNNEQPLSTISTSFAVRFYVRPANESEIATQKVYDSGANQSLDSIENSVTSDSGGGLLATIKNFFGSFFQNVFETLVSVFVPEDGFFSDWFNRLNTLLSEKLGMLYAPFDLLITTLNAIMNADSTETGIPFPGIQWENTYLVEPFTFYFSSLGDTFTDLQGYVYFATDTVLLFAFLYLLQNKIRLILEGHESG